MSLGAGFENLKHTFSFLCLCLRLGDMVSQFPVLVAMLAAGCHAPDPSWTVTIRTVSQDNLSSSTTFGQSVLSQQ